MGARGGGLAMQDKSRAWGWCGGGDLSMQAKLRVWDRGHTGLVQGCLSPGPCLHTPLTVCRLPGFLPAPSQALAGVKEKVTHLEGFLSQVSTEHVEQAAMIKQTSDLVAQVHQQINSDMEDAQKRYRKAIDEVGMAGMEYNIFVMEE